MRTLHIAIAFVIHSVSLLQEINPKGWCAVRTLHIAIAFVIHSVDRSYKKSTPKAGAQCAPYI